MNKITLKDKIEIAKISDREEEEQEVEDLNTEETKLNPTPKQCNSLKEYIEELMKKDTFIDLQPADLKCPENVLRLCKKKQLNMFT